VKQLDSQGPNRLLAGLGRKEFALLSDGLEAVTLKAGGILFEVGEDVKYVYFPAQGTIAALVLHLRDNASAETAMIGLEGAVGGVISEGEKPAFTRGVVQIGGPAWRLPTEVLEKAKLQAPKLRDHFARYADCLLAQVMQSVACNAVHEADARLARWLLTIQDRSGSDELHLTQEFISQMLAVRRPYISRIVGRLESDGAIRKSRGVIVIADRPKLEREACECYAYLRRHFERVLPGVYPP
jgi:CRP-like cAMP-binding protein